MSKTKEQLEDLTIVVSRYWPLKNLKDIKLSIEKEGSSGWNNTITLDERQSQLAYKALTEELFADTHVELKDQPAPRPSRERDGDEQR